MPEGAPVPAARVHLAADLSAGSVLLLDGATGTELERRGVACPAPLWSAAALRTAPETVAQIHRDYAAAGAAIVVANTFRTNPRTLARTGLLRDGPALNRQAIALARRAVESVSRAPATGSAARQPSWPQTARRVLVAASAGPVEDCYRPERTPAEAVLRAEHGQMADWLAGAQPDLVWIETQNTVREASAAAAAATERGLPFVVSFVLQESGALLGGEPLEAAVAAVEPYGPLAFGVNCIPPRGVTAALPRLRRATHRPLVAYAHVNNTAPLRGWSYAEALAPETYAECGREWVALGAQIVGGCCGTTPAHIAELRRALGTE